MLFTDIFMMFINIKRPQNAKLCDSCKRKVLSMQVSDHSGADIVKMTKFSRSNIVATIRGNAWDSKNKNVPREGKISEWSHAIATENVLREDL